MRKGFICFLLSILIFICTSVNVVAFANYSASDLGKCGCLASDSNSYGGFAYGFSGKTLYSSMLVPNHSNRYVNVPYNIKSSCQSGELSCAMYICDNKTSRYGITTMNMNNGAICNYTFERVTGAVDKTFSLTGSYAYFIRSDAAYSYVAVYGTDGNLKKQCCFNMNVYSLFNNNSVTYAMLYDGRIYRFSGTSYTQVARIDKAENIFNAGVGYICTESGMLVSIENSETTSVMHNNQNCIVKADGGIYAANNNRVSFTQKNAPERFIELSRTIKCIVAYNGRIAVLNDSYYFDDISNSELKSNADRQIDSKQENNFNSQSRYQNNTEITKEYRVIQGKYIVGVAPSTAVSHFKKQFFNNVTVYNSEGSVVSIGNIKTGYTASIGNESYIIVILGDLTGEGNVKSNDVNMLMNYLINAINLNEMQMVASDYDCNGAVDNRDLVYIARNTH